MVDLRIARLAQVMVNYSARVQAGEQVLIHAYPDGHLATPLLRELYREVLRAGGSPFTYMNLEGSWELMLAEASEDQLGVPDPILRYFREHAPIEFRVRSHSNTRHLSGIDPRRMSLRWRAASEVLETMRRREAEGSFRWALTLFPTPASAQEADMSLEAFEDLVYSGCFADREDPVGAWAAMHDEQERLVRWLAGRREVRLQGPDIDLSLSIEGRPFMNCSGRNNLPDGEIAASPLEASANGWVRFSFPAIESGHRVEGIELHFEQGRVVRATALRGEEQLLAMLDTDPGSRYLGELGIGTNHQLKRWTGSMLLDEKMGGTIHLALGSGLAGFGGQNQSAIHVDLLCDMHNGGRILVDGELFYDSGTFRI